MALIYKNGFGDLATEGYESCDPRDVACVSRNAARGIAINQSNEIARANEARDACNRDAALNPTLPNNCDAWWPTGYAGGIPAPYVASQYSQQVYAESFLTPMQAVANVFTPNDIGGYTYHIPDTLTAITAIGNKPSTSQMVVNQLQKSNASNPANGNMPMVGGLMDSFVAGLKSILSPGEWGNVFGSGDIAAIAGLTIPAMIAAKIAMGRR